MTQDQQAQASKPKWHDLSARLLSGLLMGGIGIAAIIAGGVWFQMLAVFVTAVMVWEIWVMIRGASPTSGMLAAAAVASIQSASLTVGPGAPVGIQFYALFLIAPLVGALTLPRAGKTFFTFCLAIQVAGWGLVHFRLEYGFTWLVWLVLVVIATDIAGYFVGKSVGGPKFWPRVSPNKTWSGTVGGWVAAALVGLVFSLVTSAGLAVVWLSVLASFAGQMGDIAESAFKRRQGVKDSSNLIPGHGGLFDRFDALLGASLFLLLVAEFFNVPGVRF